MAKTVFFEESLICDDCDNWTKEGCISSGSFRCPICQKKHLHKEGREMKKKDLVKLAWGTKMNRYDYTEFLWELAWLNSVNGRNENRNIWKMYVDAMPYMNIIRRVFPGGC